MNGSEVAACPLHFHSIQLHSPLEILYYIFRLVISDSPSRHERTKGMTSRIETTHNWSTPEQWEWPLQHHDGVVQVHSSPYHFEVGLDCAPFTPHEIEVGSIISRYYYASTPIPVFLLRYRLSTDMC